jgi:hypothetical protein
MEGHFTPSMVEGMTRLGTWMPFARAAQELGYFWQVSVAEATVRRQAQAAGAAYVQIQEEEVQRLEREAPPAPAGPARQFLSVDGAMVPLVGGEWAEVKTLVIGEVMPPEQRHGETVIQTGDLSYFSRLTDAQTFQRLALVETHRRGVESAEDVAAVTDGSEWCQGFVDFHRPTAIRILDFPHAAEHVAQVGQAVWGEDTPETQAWLTTQLHGLKQDGPLPILTAVRSLSEMSSAPPETFTHLAYLEKRQAHMQYPTFLAAGWPIGDGAVESGNKLVVEARLKGSGMHWSRPQVNSMLTLRNIACNDRWEEAWPQIVTQRRRQTSQRRHARHLQRQQHRPAVPPDLTELPLPPVPTSVALPGVQPAMAVAPSSPDKPKQPWRPPPNHPWRQPFLLKTKRQLNHSMSRPKL